MSVPDYTTVIDLNRFVSAWLVQGGQWSWQLFLTRVSETWVSINLFELLCLYSMGSQKLSY